MALPGLLAHFLPDILKRSGFKQVALKVEEVGWAHLKLKDVALDDVLAAKRLDITFNPSGITGFSAERLRLNAATDWKSLRLGPVSLPFSGGTRDGGNIALPSLNLDQARISLETPLGNLNGQLESERDGSSTRLRLDLSSPSKPALTAPLVLTAILNEEDDRLRFAGRLNDPDHRIEIKFHGWQSGRENSGKIELKLERTEFSQTGLQPQTLFPVLAGYLKDVSGPMEGRIQFSWQDGFVTSDGEIASHGLSFDANGAQVRNLMGTLSLDRVWPPRTPGLQNFSVGLLSAGVPLGSGSFAFALEEDGSAFIKRAALNLADGKLRLDPVRLGPGMNGRLNFKAEGVDLAKLAPLFRIDGMALGGLVDGTVPVLLERDGIRVAEAKLTARENGFLRYRPQTPPHALQDGGEAVSLMMAALKDFQYDSLAVALDGQAGGETTVAFHIKGRNPGLSDGAPFEFNFKLTGPLDRLARQAYGIVSHPEAIEAALANTKR